MRGVAIRRAKIKAGDHPPDIIKILFIQRAVEFVLGVEAGDRRFGERFFGAVPGPPGVARIKKKTRV